MRYILLHVSIIVTIFFIFYIYRELYYCEMYILHIFYSNAVIVIRYFISALVLPVDLTLMLATGLILAVSCLQLFVMNDNRNIC